MRPTDSSSLASRHAMLDGIESMILLSDGWATPQLDKRMLAYPNPHRLAGELNYYHDPQATQHSLGPLPFVAANESQPHHLQQRYADQLEAEISKFCVQQDLTCKLLCEMTFEKDLCVLRELQTQGRMRIEQDALNDYCFNMARFWEKKYLIQEIHWRDRLHAESLRLALADEQRERAVLKAQQEGSTIVPTLMAGFMKALNQLLASGSASRQAVGEVRETLSAIGDDSQKRKQRHLVAESVERAKSASPSSPSTFCPETFPVLGHKEVQHLLAVIQSTVRAAVEPALELQRKEQESVQPSGRSVVPTTPPAEEVLGACVVPARAPSGTPSSAPSQQALLFRQMRSAYEDHTMAILNLCAEKADWVLDQSMRQSMLRCEDLTRGLKMELSMKAIEIKYLKQEVDRLRSFQEAVASQPPSGLENARRDKTPASETKGLARTVLEGEKKPWGKLEESFTFSDVLARYANARGIYIPRAVREPKMVPLQSIEALREEARRLGVKRAVHPVSAPVRTAPAPAPAPAPALTKPFVWEAPTGQKQASVPNLQSSMPSFQKRAPTSLNIKSLLHKIEQDSLSEEDGSSVGLHNPRLASPLKSAALEPLRPTLAAPRPHRDVPVTCSMPTLKPRSASGAPTTGHTNPPQSPKSLIKSIPKLLDGADQDDKSSTSTGSALNGLVSHSSAGVAGTPAKRRKLRGERETRDSVPSQTSHKMEAYRSPEEGCLVGSSPDSLANVHEQKREIHPLGEILLEKNQSLRRNSFEIPPQSPRHSQFTDHTLRAFSTASDDISLTPLSTPPAKQKLTVTKTQLKTNSQAATKSPTPKPSVRERSAKENTPPAHPVLKRSSFDEDTDE